MRNEILKFMNKHHPFTVKGSFEEYFEAPATAHVPFRVTQETEFERLKNKLLTEKLLAAAQPTLNDPIRRAANEAAALAWVTFYPLLVFPVLFEEKARTALRQTTRQSHIYARSRELLVA